jgi:hypothetical protein
VDGPDRFLFHVPDLREFWKVPQAWQYRDVQRLELQNQPFPNCDGVYMIFFSFALDDLPQNNNFPVALMREGTFWEDVFVVKLQPHEYGEHGWAAYDDVPPEFLQLPFLRWDLDGTLADNEIICPRGNQAVMQTWTPPL